LDGDEESIDVQVDLEEVLSQGSDADGEDGSRCQKRQSLSHASHVLPMAERSSDAQHQQSQRCVGHHLRPTRHERGKEAHSGNPAEEPQRPESRASQANP
jgi:hypothetical protein